MALPQGSANRRPGRESRQSARAGVSTRSRQSAEASPGPPLHRDPRRLTEEDEVLLFRMTTALLTLAFLLALLIVELGNPRTGPLAVTVLSIAALIALLWVDARALRRLSPAGKARVPAGRRALPTQAAMPA